MQTNRLKKRSRIPYEDMLANILKNDRNVTDEQFKKARKTYQDSLLCKSKDNIPKVPTTINIELVNKCNYACKMCYTVNHIGVKNQLSKETLFSIIDQASDLGIFTVMFGMGSEATLHPNLLEVLTYACKRIPDVILFTNGSRIKPKDVCKYVETGVTRICISLDAADQEIYKLIRGGNLAEVEEVIDEFMSQQTKFGRPLVRVSFCNQPSNEHQQEAFSEKWINRVDSVEIQKCRSLDHLSDLEAINSSSKYKTISNTNHCIRPFSYLSIWSDGLISPCCSFHGTKIKLGSIYENTLQDAWTSKFYNNIRDEFSYNSLNPICNDCMNGTFK